jgi:hypothetical protein
MIFSSPSELSIIAGLARSLASELDLHRDERELLCADIDLTWLSLAAACLTRQGQPVPDAVLHVFRRTSI